MRSVKFNKRYVCLETIRFRIKRMCAPIQNLAAGIVYKTRGHEPLTLTIYFCRHRATLASLTGVDRAKRS